MPSGSIGCHRHLTEGNYLVFRSTTDLDDFTANGGGLIADGSWRNLDLSNIIPVDSVGVLLRLRLRGSTVQCEFAVRARSTVNTLKQEIANQVVNIDIYGCVIIGNHTDRTIQYYISANANHVNTHLTVIGWFRKLML